MTQQELIFKIAKHELANKVEEIPGAKSNPRIELYHLTSFKHRETDDVPWCASAMNFCHIAAAFLLNATSTEKQMLKLGYLPKHIEELAIESGKIAYKLDLNLPADNEGPSVDVGTQSAAARSFLWNGAKTDGAVGDTCILKRTSDPSKGHVGLLVEKNLLYVKLLGGNQGDKWSIATFPRYRVLGFRRV